MSRGMRIPMKQKSVRDITTPNLVPQIMIHMKQHTPRRRPPRTVTRVTEPKNRDAIPSMTSGRSLCAWPSLPPSQRRRRQTPGSPLLRQKAGVCGRPQVRRDGTSFRIDGDCTGGVSPQVAGHTGRQVPQLRMRSINR